MQECKNARMQECKNARMQECKNARMQECKNARMQECKNARKFKIFHLPCPNSSWQLTNYTKTANTNPVFETTQIQQHLLPS